MHANDLVGTVGNHTSQLRDGDRRSVGREDGMVWHDLCDTLEDNSLDFEVLVSRLNDEIRFIERLNVTGELDSILHVLGLGFSEALLGNLLCAPVRNEIFAPNQTVLTRVNHGDVKLGDAACDDSDSGSHLAGTDDTYIAR